MTTMMIPFKLSSGVPPTSAHSSLSFSSSKFFQTSLRRSTTFPKFLHVKPGKGAAYVRTTLRNHITGNSVEKTFRAGSKSTYEEVRLNESDMGDSKKWLKEGMDYNLLFWKGKVIDFEVPLQIKVKIVDVDPGTKGEAAQGGSKPATVETGAIVYVPLFVERDQEIIVDTRTGQHVSRV